MKQQVITSSIVAVLSFSVVASLLFAAKTFSKNTSASASPIPSSLSLIDQPASLSAALQAATPNPTVAQNGQQVDNQPKAAIEIDASHSASTASAQLVRVTLSNDKSFTVATYADLAPLTVKNFVQKVRSGVYNGLLFFRVDKDQAGSAAILQTGDPTNTGQGGGAMQAEYNKKPFTAGSVGIARGQNRDINNDSQFFLVTIDQPSLTSDYTNFGDVVNGLDVVKSIHQGQPIKTIELVK